MGLYMEITNITMMENKFTFIWCLAPSLNAFLFEDNV